jgi:hypothetical protein
MSWTKLAIITKVRDDLDLQDEPIVGTLEMDGYLWDAVRKARAIILDLQEDYFLKPSTLALVLNRADYSLPTGIFASKIRGIEYDDGSRQFEIKRIRNYRKFDKVAVGNQESGAQPRYRYLLIDQSNTAGVKIRLVPPAKETSTTNVTIWHLREATQLTLDDDVCDIPDDLIDYVFVHMKGSCLRKMNNGIMPAEAKADIEDAEKTLVSALTDMTPDNDNEIEGDYTHYEEHS